MAVERRYGVARPARWGDRMNADLARLSAALEAAIGPNAPYPTPEEHAAHAARGERLRAYDDAAEVVEVCNES